MDGARDQFLADAALTLDQHRRVGRRGPTDGRHHLLQRLAVANHLMADFDRFLERSILVAQLPLIEGVAEDDQDALARERLLDEVERALLGGAPPPAPRPAPGGNP